MNPKDGVQSQSRRNFLRAGAILGADSLLGVSLPVSAALANEPGVASFMKLSRLLVNHHLDEGVGQRMWVLLKDKHSNLNQNVADILKIATQKQAKIVEDFFADIPVGELQDLAYQIIFGWYAGCLDTSAQAESFAFEQALTFQNTADVITIPSYGVSGPNDWADRPNVPVLPLRKF
ncbi:sugar dehydrogenase complex small subunit [Marinomonas ostreistagni]|uniref:sugar dehydrogenase complex small subunit n=1 Tax=Marinomonas ostreistagni TaxID=359209 RepID=UPI00194F48D0|nr:sugar dehydrogenase complex small subunit [Marinomonas ostreistagni]MBM6550571.1 hypothetical protein [Marinomonas ostreistagni]